MALSFPLQWPEGWARTPAAKRTRARYKVTPDRAQNQLFHSLHLLGVSRQSIVLSTNVPLRKDGLPYTGVRGPDDTGVAIYWTTRAHGERVMACDRWLMVHENIHAIGLAVDGLRAIERAGASQILERAFSAFGALPASDHAAPIRAWWDVFEIPEGLAMLLSIPMLEARYRELASKRHPDKTGDESAMVELNRAREQARTALGHAI